MDAYGLDCQQLAFLACTIEDVPAAVWERGGALASEGAARFYAGTDLLEVATWLRSQPDVAYATVGPHDVIFVVNGGLPYVLYDVESAEGPLSPNPTPLPASQTVGASLSAVSSAPSMPARVVGRDTRRENADLAKRALVLEPFARYHATNAAGIASMLQSVEDYGRAPIGEVTYLANEAVQLSTFANWTNYDVILFLGHGGGRQACSGNTCAPGQGDDFFYIFTGMTPDNTSPLREDTCSGFADPGSLEPFRGVPGVICGLPLYRNVPFASRILKPHVGVRAEFFQHIYGSSGGLEKTLVVLNACYSGFSDKLANSIIGPESVFYGWDTSVLINYSSQFQTAFFNLLAEEGLSTRDAEGIVCAAGGCSDADGTSLVRLGDPNGITIREVIFPLHPLTLAQEDYLETGDRIPVFGFAGDGQHDEVPVRLLVEGVKDAAALNDYSAQLTVGGGQPGPTISMVQRETELQVGNHAWEVQMRLPLGMDHTQGMPTELEVTLTLPGGGESRHLDPPTVTLENPEFSFRTVTTLQSDDALIRSNVETPWVPLSLSKLDFDVVEFTRNTAAIGKAEFWYTDFELIEQEQGPCTRDVLGLQSGDLRIPTVRFDRSAVSDSGELPAPEYVDILVAPLTEEMTELIRTTCPDGDVTIENTLFGITMLFLHQDELDTGPAGPVIRTRGWTGGAGGLLGQRSYTRSVAPATEDTVIELRFP